MKTEALTLICSLLAVAASSQAQDKSKTTMKQTTISEITANPKKFSNKQVAVSGEVDEVFGSNAFKIQNDEFFDDEILVVVPKKLPKQDRTDFEEDAKLQVSGTVRTLQIVDIEREYDFDLDTTYEAEFQGLKPVLVASSLKKTG